MSEKIIMALKLSSTVHISTGDRERREAPTAAWDSGVGTDHEIYRKSSHFCEHQEVCEDYIADFRYTLPGKLSVIFKVYTSAMCTRIFMEFQCHIYLLHKHPINYYYSCLFHFIRPTFC